MEWISNPEAWVALATLAVLEIVLGIDNIIFISILADKLPKERQASARQLGLMLAMVTRLALLGTINLIMKLTAPLFSLLGHAFSGRDLILVIGGLFPAHQGDAGNPPSARRRRRTRLKGADRELRRHPAPDRRDGHGLFPRLGDHRGGGSRRTLP